MNPKRRRRWIGAFALAALVATFLGGFLLFRDWRANAEEDAFQAGLAKWGGQSRIMPHSDVSSSRVLRIVGEDIYSMFVGSRGRAVAVFQPDVTPEQLAQLHAHQPIGGVLASGTKRLDDAWMRGLTNHDRMEHLFLNETGVTDRSVEVIVRMRHLLTLGLVETAVSDAGVAQLRELPDLAELQVGGPNIQAVRLLGLELLDLNDQPTTRAEALYRIKGRITVENTPGIFGDALLLINPEGEPLSRKSTFHGLNVRHRYQGKLIAEKPGIWTFDIPILKIEAGSSWLVLWVNQSRTDRFQLVHYRLEPIRLDLEPEPAPSAMGREGVAGPTPPR